MIVDAPKVKCIMTIPIIALYSFYIGTCFVSLAMQVIVLPNDGLPVLQNPVAADCGANASCYFSYSTDSTYTPKLLNIRVSLCYSTSLMINFSKI